MALARQLWEWARHWHGGSGAGTALARRLWSGHGGSGVGTAALEWARRWHGSSGAGKALAACPSQAGSRQPRGVAAFPRSQWDNVGNYSPVRWASVLGSVMEELTWDPTNKNLKWVIQPMPISTGCGAQPLPD